MLTPWNCLLVIFLGLDPGSSAASVDPSDSLTAAVPSAPEPAGPTIAGPADSPVANAISAAFDATAASKYLFQGIDYSNGKGVVQPDFVATRGSLSAVAWANYQPDLGNLNEIDLSLKYARSFQKLSVSPGYTYLRYPHRMGWNPSQEITLDLGVQTHLSPTLSLHYDVDAGRGLYATLGMSQTLRSPVTVGTNIFYQSHYYEMSGFPAIELKASAALTFGAVSLSPSISRMVTWANRDFRDASGIPSSWLFSLNVARPIPL